MVSEEFAAQHTQWSLVSTASEVPVTSSKRLGKGEEVSEVFYSKTLIETLTETIYLLSSKFRTSSIIQETDTLQLPN